MLGRKIGRSNICFNSWSSMLQLLFPHVSWWILHETWCSCCGGNFHIQESNDLISFLYIFKCCTYVFSMLHISYFNIATEHPMEKFPLDVQALANPVWDLEDMRFEWTFLQFLHGVLLIHLSQLSTVKAKKVYDLREQHTRPGWPKCPYRGIGFHAYRWKDYTWLNQYCKINFSPVLN